LRAADLLQGRLIKPVQCEAFFSCISRLLLLQLNSLTRLQQKQR